MRNDTMGIILTSENKISPITDKRASCALPIAGRYRVIDFILSNMTNAGITKIGVATESKYSSLMDHIKSGGPWDLDRKNGGLYVLPPSLENLKYGSLKGNIGMLAGIMNFVRKSHETYVVLALGGSICNIDLEKAVEAHIEKQADVTVIYKDMTGAEEAELSRYTLIDMDENNRVTGMEVTPAYPKTAYSGMGIYVLEKALLESIIDECSSRGDRDFARDAIARQIGGLRVYAYEHKGYFGKIDSIQAYYENSMNFLNTKIRREIFNRERPIYTKTKDQFPTKYKDGAVVKNCFVSDGCIIEGYVENSIISRGVKIAKGAIVKNSIIMQDSVVEAGVELEHVVCDKEVRIKEYKKLLGQPNYPMAIEKGAVI